MRLMVIWKTYWHRGIHAAKRLADEGRIGRLLGIYPPGGSRRASCRLASRAPSRPGRLGWLIDATANGGGAAVDFCCYGAAISRWFIGRPEHVLARGS